MLRLGAYDEVQMSYSLTGEPCILYRISYEYTVAVIVSGELKASCLGEGDAVGLPCNDCRIYVAQQCTNSLGGPRQRKLPQSRQIACFGLVQYAKYSIVQYSTVQ